jgi:hypothetical protein
LGEGAHLAGFFLLNILKRIEVFDFAGEAHGKFTCIELRDRTSTTLARDQPGPRRRKRIAERRNQA